MAVELCYTGKPPKEVVEELGIAIDIVRRWKREYEQYHEGGFSGNGNAKLTSDQKEIIRLKKDLKDAQIESDNLKKAVSIFSRSDGKYFNS